jgi:hypothetical protein
MSAKRRRKKRTGAGRFFEIVADATLLTVILAFGVSIAARYGPKEPEVRPTGGIALPRDATPGPASGTIDPNRPTVDIRNGCGQGGLAEEMMMRLRRAGFDVVEYKDADNYNYTHTLVKDRAGNPEAAGQVCAWLQREFGVGETVRDVVPTPASDVLLILGSDLADSLRARQGEVQRH